MHIQWDVAIIGLVVWIVGVVLLVFRRKLTRVVGVNATAIFGKLGGPLARADPKVLGITGVLFAVFGALLVVLGVLLRPYHP